MEFKVTLMRTEIVVCSIRTQNVVGTKGKRIHELTSVVWKRFKFPETGVEFYFEKLTTESFVLLLRPSPFVKSSLMVWMFGSNQSIPCLFLGSECN